MQHEPQRSYEMQQAWLALPAIHKPLPCCVETPMLGSRLGWYCLQGADPPFLYGTHYSCPGYVMYWLVRAAPAHLLRLQNGRFDAPDRMFLSLADSWDSVTRNPADVKELIPEFFLGHGRWGFGSASSRVPEAALACSSYASADHGRPCLGGSRWIAFMCAILGAVTQ